MKNNEELSPFRTESIQIRNSISDSESPFNILSENEFEQLDENLLTNQNTYIVTNDQEEILKIKTVLKYVLLTFKTNENELIHQKKSLPGEDLVTSDLPKFKSTENLETNLMEYSIYTNWKNQDNQLIPSIVPSHNNTYFPTVRNIKTSRYASIFVSSDFLSGQEEGFIAPFKIYSPINLYFTDTTYMGYTFKPEIIRETVEGNIQHKVSFKIDGLIYKPGQSESYEVTYKIFDDQQLRNEIFEMYVRILVSHKSGQPIGD